MCKTGPVMWTVSHWRKEGLNEIEGPEESFEDRSHYINDGMRVPDIEEKRLLTEGLDEWTRMFRAITEVKQWDDVIPMDTFNFYDVEAVTCTLRIFYWHRMMLSSVSIAGQWSLKKSEEQ